MSYSKHFFLEYNSFTMTHLKIIEMPFELNRILSFPLRISSVNVTISAGNCEFDHIY